MSGGRPNSDFVKTDKEKFKVFLNSMNIKYIDKGSSLSISNEHIWECYVASLVIEFNASGKFVEFATTGD